LKWLNSIIKNKSQPRMITNDNYIPNQLPIQNLNNNQFEVPKTNILKRNKTNISTPPIISNTNVKSKLIKEEMEQFNKLKVNANSNNNGPSVINSNNLFGFLENEMSGFSDPYAYLLIDNALPKSFLP